MLMQQQELRELEQKMKQAASLTDATYEQLLNDYDKKQQLFAENGGYEYEASIKSVLTGLNFHNIPFDTLVNN